MEPKKDKTASPKGAPRLRAVSVEADTVDEAMLKVKGKGTPAGQAELDYVLDPKNCKKVSQMFKFKSGTYYFFPGAAVDDDVPSVFQGDDGFWKLWDSANYYRQNFHSRVVLQD